MLNLQLGKDYSANEAVKCTTTYRDSIIIDIFWSIYNIEM